VSYAINIEIDPKDFPHLVEGGYYFAIQRHFPSSPTPVQWLSQLLTQPNFGVSWDNQFRVFTSTTQSAGGTIIVVSTELPAEPNNSYSLTIDWAFTHDGPSSLPGSIEIVNKTNRYVPLSVQQRYTDPTLGKVFSTAGQEPSVYPGGAVNFLVSESESILLYLTNQFTEPGIVIAPQPSNFRFNVVPAVIPTFSFKAGSWYQSNSG